MKYRSEIDGLRALAVVPVILFHAGFNAFSGGFVGVDVFFVISGYLITTILLNDLEAGKFSIVHFYERRARRILPALFLVMFACLPFAWFWLLPQDMKSFSQSLVAVSVFASNILFWRTSGYFDTATELKPLIHTWSLSVEEQYYVLFPLFLFFAWRLGKRWTVGILAVVALVSLGLAQWGAYAKPAFTFYMLPTRAWELLIGAFVAFYYSEHNIKKHKYWASELGSLLGFALITYATFAFTEKTPFPSLYALVPTIGAALIIVFATNKTLIGKLLSTKPFLWIGLISYSAYLWHQPLFAFARQRSIYETSQELLAALAIITLPLAFLTWRFVERPFRNKHQVSRRRIFIISTIVSGFFLTLGLTGHILKGVPSRFQKIAETQDIELPRIDNGWCFYSIDNIQSLTFGQESLNCALGNTDSKLKGVLFGDSYAGHYEPMLDIAGKQDQFSIHSITTNWCYPSSTSEFTGPPNSRSFQQCLFNRDYLNKHFSDYDFVVLSGAWGNILEQDKLEGVLSLIRRSAKESKFVLVMASPKQYDKNVMDAYKKSLVFDSAFDISKFSYKRDDITTKAHTLILQESKKHTNVIFVDRASIYGDSETTANGIPLSLDGGHISILGSKTVSDNFLRSEIYQDFVKKLTALGSDTKKLDKDF